MALSGAASNGFGQKPMNVAGIVKEAGNFNYDTDIPLRYWFRTADAIQKQAYSYERDGQEQDAYLFFMRHAILASEKLPKHPDYKAPDLVSPRKKLQKDLLHDIQIMEALRPKINERYERYSKALARLKAEREQWAAEHARHASLGTLTQDFEHLSTQDRTGSGHVKERLELNPGKGENHKLALSLANKELRRRQGGRRSSKAQNRLQEQNESRAEDGAEEDDLAQRIRATAKRSEQAYLERNGFQQDGYNERGQHRHAYNYPSVPSKHAQVSGGNKLPSYSDSTQRSELPVRPLKEYFLDQGPAPPPKEQDIAPIGGSQAPPRPDKISEIPEAPSRSVTATPDISTKDYSFTATARTESDKPLRTVFINPTMRTEFLKIASPNTLRNLETCGILCGTLISNAFFISKLVIPEQESTSDTCDTVNETALFDYCDSHDLMTLGWIHTHPTQTCFMSSRDLHTHGGYQVQMAESIAIVCAPKHEPSYGVFRLTDPPGLKTILECRQTGLFHPHAQGNVYTDAMRPGHVQELKGLGFEVVDLRPK